MEVSSQVIMGATLMLAATIAIVLSLVLVLLAKLYCSLLVRRRRCHSQQQEQLPGHAALATALSATSATTIPSHSSVNPTPSTLSSFYAHGVLHAPRSLLFPTLTSTEIAAKQCDLFEDGLRDAVPTSNHPVYISNPVYNSDATGGAKNRLPNAPFKTPDSCPSCPPSGGDNECDDEIRAWTGQEAANTPPLTPMKDLPAQACSIPLRDAGSLCTGSRSDSNTNHRLPSSSSSGTPCTSPSW